MRAAGKLIGFISCGTLAASGLIVEDRDIHPHHQDAIPPLMLKHATAESLRAKSSIMYDAAGNKYDENGVVMGLPGMLARMVPALRSKGTSMVSETQEERKVKSGRRRRSSSISMAAESMHQHKHRKKSAKHSKSKHRHGKKSAKHGHKRQMPCGGMMPGGGGMMGMPGGGMMPGGGGMMGMMGGMPGGYGGMPGGAMRGPMPFPPNMHHPGMMHPGFLQHSPMWAMMGGGSGGVWVHGGAGGAGGQPCMQQQGQQQEQPCPCPEKKMVPLPPCQKPCGETDPARDAPGCSTPQCPGNQCGKIGFGSTGLAEGYRSGYFAGRGCSDNPSYRDSHGYNCWGWEGYDCSGSTMFQGYGANEYVQMRMLCPKTCGLC